MENSIMSYVLDNLNKLFFPGEWIDIDMSFSKSEILTMMVVDRHGEIIMSQAAGYINVPMSTATGIVDRLVRNGYLKRDRSEADRRVVVIRLTDKGRDIVNKFKDSILGYISKVNEALTDEEREVLYKVFLKVMDVLGKDGSSGPEGNSTESSIKRIDIE